MEERKKRWRMLEAAKRERARGRTVRVLNKEMWVNGKKWEWEEGKEEREEGEGK